MSLTVGSRVGPYEIVEAIGAGGMGVVFRARDHALGRDVAIKTLPQAVADDPDRRQRFVREARLLASLNHAHIAHVYGIEDSSAGSAIVMELVPGATLREVIRQGTVGTRDALDYARQIALALDAAHEKGVVHRDLKPDNIKVTPEGQVKVLDFGLAKATAEEEGAGGSQTATAAGTRIGQVMGTAAYMSPEQARGLPVDRRTDIWAFGCVLFEMFSGRIAFDAPTASDTISAVLGRDPDWESLPDSTPGRVRGLIARCLEKDRRERLRDIGDALPGLADSPPTADAPSPARRSPEWRRLSLASGVLTCVLAGTTAWLWMQSRAALAPVSASRPVRFELPPPSGARFGSSIPSIEATGLAFSPDGTRLAFVGMPKGGPSRVFVRAFEEEQARAVPGTEGAISVFWSPDNRSLGFFVSGKLRRIDQDGGAAVPICDTAEAVGLNGTWGSTGDILYSSVTGDGIWRVPAAGGSPSVVIRSPDARTRVMWPHHLPDGRRFLFTAMGGDRGGEVVLVDAQGAEHSIMPARSRAQFVEPDLLLVVRESTLIGVRIDLVSGRPIGEPVSVMGPVAHSTATGWAEFAASLQGSIALQSHRDVSRLTLVNGSGTPERSLGAPGGYLSVRRAPDGVSVTFPRMRPELGTYDIWSATLDRGSETPLTQDPGMETGEVWLPDQRTLVIAASRGGPPNLVLRDIGSGNERPLAHSPRFQYPTDVSPDGTVVAYQQRTERGSWDLMAVRVKDSEVQPIATTPASEESLRFNPADATTVAFVSDESGRPEVYVAPFASPGQKIMASSGVGAGTPRWRRDGRQLYYLSAGGLIGVPVDPNGRPGHATRLFEAPGWTSFDVLDNGTRFVAVVSESIGHEQPLTVLLDWRRMIGMMAQAAQ